jgi:hypothetical protein
MKKYFVKSKQNIIVTKLTRTKMTIIVVAFIIDFLTIKEEEIISQLVPE